MRESSELRVTRMLFVASFLVAAVLLAGLALARPTRASVAASYLWIAALVAGTILIGRSTGGRRRYLRIFLLAAVLNLVLVPPELFLRIRGFRYESGIQFGYPRPYQFGAFEPHEELFWRFPPSRPGVNSYGFEGSEPAMPKPAGIYRIVFLGNSCTWHGAPAMVELILRDAQPGVECLNFATPGYSSHQGAVIARTFLGELEPNLVIASYGWNDRWLAYGAPDHDKRIVAERSSIRRFASGLEGSWRLLQYVRKILAPAMTGTEPLATARVPLDRFRGNLEAIGNAAEELGASFVLVTEPSSHPSAGVPRYIVASKYARSNEEALSLFRQYNGAVRALAREHPAWHLIDLDALMSARSDVRALFTEDGIHFSKAGLAVVADAEASYLRERLFASHGTRNR